MSKKKKKAKKPKIKIVDCSKGLSDFYKYDFKIVNTRLKNPFFTQNGWNIKESQRFDIYTSWFKSCLRSEQKTPFIMELAKMKKKLKKYGKIRLLCDCKGKYCISKYIKNYLLKGDL